MGSESMYVMGLAPQWEVNLSFQSPEIQRHWACRCSHPDAPSTCHCVSCIQWHGLCKTSFGTVGTFLLLDMGLRWSYHVLVREQVFLDQLTQMSPTCCCFGHDMMWISSGKLLQEPSFSLWLEMKGQWGQRRRTRQNKSSNDYCDKGPHFQRSKGSRSKMLEGFRII